MIRKAINQNKESKVIVIGCCAQSNYKILEKINGIDIILGNNEKYNVLQELDSLKIKKNIIKVKPIKNITRYNTVRNKQSHLRSRALVKIQDGCNNFCSYCKIPYVRGPERSRLPEDIMEEISFLDKTGTKEIVLLGINLGTYGNDFYTKKTNLTNLISLINDNFKQIRRIRLSSIELLNVDSNLLDAFNKYPKLCHHLHIPLQSGSDKILKLMNRPYGLESFSKIIKNIRKNIPDVAITTDVMVGFPGEDDKSFNDAYNYIKKMEFAKIHVFPYSDREKCLSNLLPDKIDYQIRKDRIKKLLKLSKDLYFNFRNNYVGRITEVLIEDEKVNDDGSICSYGITGNYIRVMIPNLSGKKDKIIKVKLNKIYKEYIIASV